MLLHVAPSIRVQHRNKIDTPYHHMAGLQGNAGLLANANKGTLVEYNFDGNGIKKTLEKSLPHNVSAEYRKYRLQDGQIAFKERWGKGTTFIYTEDLQVCTEYTKDYGELIGALPSNCLAYAKNGQVHVYDRDHHQLQVLTLQPSKGNKLSEHLSVCAHPTTGYIVIVSRNPNCLDIYNSNGEFTYIYTCFSDLQLLLICK